MTSSKPQNDATKLARMIKDKSKKNVKVRDRLAKLMDGYKKRNSY
jgi:hypothetical protein